MTSWFRVLGWRVKAKNNDGSKEEFAVPMSAWHFLAGLERAHLQFFVSKDLKRGNSWSSMEKDILAGRWTDVSVNKGSFGDFTKFRVMQVGVGIRYHTRS